MRLTMQDWPLVLDQRHTYPWAYHWLLALMPESWLLAVPPLPSALCDAVHASLVALLGAYVAPLVNANLEPAIVGLVAGTLFGTAPALLVVGFGPRAYEVTPRPFGELVYTVMMTGALLYLVDGRAGGLLLAILAGGLLLLSSKFGAQVLLFCTPLMAAYTQDLRVLVLVPAALVTALALSAGGYWWVLRTQVQHLRHYRRKTQYEHPVLAHRNRTRDLLRSVWQLVAHPRDHETALTVARLAEGHTLLQFLVRNVLWCVVVVLLLAGVLPHWAGGGSAWRLWLLAWGVAPVGPFVLASLRHYRFLGEAERYPEYGLAPIAVLAAAAALSVPAVLGHALALGYAITLVPAYMYTLLRLRWNSRSQALGELDELVRFLRQWPADTVVMPVPWHLAFQVMPGVDIRHLAGLDANTWCRDPDPVFARYPWIRPDIAEWRRAAGVTLVMADLQALQSGDAVDYGLSRFSVLFHNSRYEVYDVRG